MEFTMNKQSGQTLLQMIGIAAAAGILLVGVSFFLSRPANEKSRTDIIYQSSQKILSNWVQLNNQSSTSTRVLGNENIIAGKTALDVLAIGESAVNPGKIVNYKNSGIMPLSILLTPDNGGYKIFDYPVTIEGGEDKPLELSVANLSGKTANFLQQNPKVTNRNGKLYIELSK
jgi:hypothetical protein